jgi:hypothetical protein
LRGEGKRVEGLEEDCGYAETGDAALIYTLNFGGQQNDGYAGDGGDSLHLLEGGGTVHLGHHYVHQDGFRLLLEGYINSVASTGRGVDGPTGRGFQRKRRYFADIVFIIDDQDSFHKTIVQGAELSDRV